MQATPPVDSLIEYPSDFPIKVMGPTHEDFAATIVDVVLEHDPDFPHRPHGSAPFRQGQLHGPDRDRARHQPRQLDKLYRALSGHPWSRSCCKADKTAAPRKRRAVLLAYNDGSPKP